MVNNKGQALIEAVFITPIAILFFIYIIQVLLYVSVEIAIDDAMEGSLLCEIQSRHTCQSDLNQYLSHLPLSNTQTQFQKNNNNYRISLSATALRFFRIKKIRQLQYETQI